MRMRIMAAAVIAAAVGVTLPSNAQDAAKPKPNIAVSGCLMREGYGTYIVAKANIDAIGDGVESAKPGTGKPASPGAPPKWILDHPGPIGQQVGQTIQVIGVSSWVDETKGGSQTSRNDEPASAPHINVQSVKVVADTCP